MSHRTVVDMLAGFGPLEPVVSRCLRCGWVSPRLPVDEAQELFAGHACTAAVSALPPSRSRPLRRSSR